MAGPSSSSTIRVGRFPSSACRFVRHDPPLTIPTQVNARRSRSASRGPTAFSAARRTETKRGESGTSLASSKMAAGVGSCLLFRWEPVPDFAAARSAKRGRVRHRRACAHGPVADQSPSFFCSTEQSVLAPLPSVPLETKGPCPASSA